MFKMHLLNLNKQSCLHFRKAVTVDEVFISECDDYCELIVSLILSSYCPKDDNDVEKKLKQFMEGESEEFEECELHKYE